MATTLCLNSKTNRGKVNPNDHNKSKKYGGVTSITTPSGSDNLFTVHTNNTTERVRINNDGDVIVDQESLMT